MSLLYVWRLALEWCDHPSQPHANMFVLVQLCLAFFFFLVSDAITNWVFLDNEYGQNYYSQQEGKIIFLKDFKKITMKMKLLWNLLQNKLYIIWGI